MLVPAPNLASVWPRSEREPSAHAHAQHVQHVQHVHSERIDSNVTLVQLARVFVGSFGLTSVLAALCAPQTRQRERLQCILATTSCAVVVALYTSILELRRGPHAYNPATNNRVESSRYASWIVTHSLLAWLSLSVRGPFAPSNPTFLEYTYEEWKQLSVSMTALAVVFGGAGIFFALRAHHSASGRCGYLWWTVLSILSIATAVAISATVSTALHQPADEHLRSENEILVGFAMSRVWVVYPLTSLAKAIVAYFSAHDVSGALDRKLGHRLGHSIVLAGEELRCVLINGVRALSAARDYRSLRGPHSTSALHRQPLLPTGTGGIGGIGIGAGFDDEVPLDGTTLPVLYVQIFESWVAALDIVAVGLPALAATVFALPVRS